jgi:PAS domain S-box-containing protein
MEPKLKRFLSTTQNPVIGVAKDGIVLYSNETGETLLYKMGTGIGEKLPPYIVDFVQRVISRNNPEKTEVKVGKRTYLFTFQPLHEKESVNIYGFDISDHKKLEEDLKKASGSLSKALENLEKQVEERTIQLEKAYNLLRESEKGLLEAQTMAHAGNWEWDIVTDEAYWSDELYRIFKRNPEELAPSYKEYLNYVHPDDRDYVDNAFKQAINGKTHSINHRIILANGEERAVNIKLEVIFNGENIPIRIKAIVQDVTELKKAEEKIKSLVNIVESSNDAIITKSLDGIITRWNKGAEHVYGYSAEEILGKEISILAPDNLKGEINQLIEEIKQGKKIHNYETLRLRKDGTIINVSLTLSPVFDVSGKLTDVSIIARDITKRKEVEEALANLEAVRKKEIHHRIKNNLQVISSLIDLQAEKFKGRKDIKDSEVIEAFRESQDRVISMALIHEELYEGDGFEKLNFLLYIEKLVENIFQKYKLGNTDISLNMDMEENLLFDMDTAVPLGMIVNELVSNSLKHAFIGRDKGEILIKLCRIEPAKFQSGRAVSNNENFQSTSFILTISDNGVGIPENIDIEDLESLGLQLVTTLVDQLDGELELRRNNGTEFTMGFTVTEKNKQESAPALK